MADRRTLWRGWPTIYVLDPEGVIRYKNVRGDAMDAAIEEARDVVVVATE